MKKIKYFLEVTYPIWLGYIIFFLINIFLEKNTALIVKTIPYVILVTAPLVVPSLLLFVNYLKVDSNVKSLRINEGKLVEIYLKNNKCVFVDNVILIKRDERKDIYFSFLSWDKFRYYKVTTKEGVFFVTCLRNEFYLIKIFDGIIFKNYPSITIDENEAVSDENSMVNHFEKKFEEKSITELENIIKRKSDFSKDAFIAAQNLLKKKRDK